LHALGIEVAGELAVLATPTWPAMNRNSDAFTRVMCEYCPSGLPSVSGLMSWIGGMELHPRWNTDGRAAG
jgi:hypothetical protein